PTRGQRGEQLLRCRETSRRVHRLDLDLDQVALRIETGIGQCGDEAEAAVLALRDRQWPVHERDPAGAQLKEGPAAQPAAGDVVDDDGRDVTGRASVVEKDERDAAVGEPFEIAL